MEQNTWYWTLSTISQTLGAVLALTAVFTVLRLESLRKNIDDYKGRALDIVVAKDKHLNSGKKSWDKVKIILDDLKEFNQNYETRYRDVPGIKSEMEILINKYSFIGTGNYIDRDINFVADTFENLDSFVGQRKDVINWVVWPGEITSLTIAVSIMLLSLSDWAINHSSLLLLLFVAALALFSLGSVIWACWKILSAIKTLE